MRRAILTGLILCLAGPVSAESVKIFGAGVITCGRLTQVYETQDRTNQLVLTGFYAGFFTGYAIATEINIVGDFDSAAIEQAVRNHCRANPLDPLVMAARTVAENLKARRTGR